MPTAGVSTGHFPFTRSTVDREQAAPSLHCFGQSLLLPALEAAKGWLVTSGKACFLISRHDTSGVERSRRNVMLDRAILSREACLDLEPCSRHPVRPRWDPSPDNRIGRRGSGDVRKKALHWEAV